MQLLEAGAVPPVQYPDTLTLSYKAKSLYETLRQVAIEVAKARGYCAGVTQIHFFCPGEIIAFALGIARSTFYLKLAELEAADLVEGRGHFVSHRGQTKADGMVWAVKLYPERDGRVRVPHDALKQSYRCLSTDVERGRTAWQKIGQSKGTQEKPDAVKEILNWALPPSTPENPVTLLTVRSDLERLLDLPYVQRDERSEAVDGAARALAMGLGDVSSLMFYRWLLWQLLRLEDACGVGYWFQLYEGARRARADALEGFARKPGALFVSRLKRAPWWDEMCRQPPVRVGKRRQVA